MILITGASGNVGSEVLKQAMAAKLKLTAAYQSAEKAQTAPGNVHTVVLDYAKPETIRAALEGVDILFLVGPPTANLVALEANVIDEAQKAGITHLVKLSALGGGARRSSRPCTAIRKRELKLLACLIHSCGRMASCRTS